MEQNLKLFKNSNIHDYELLKINVNYLDSEINISFNTATKTNLNICIKNFMTFEISHKEPWGKGSYVCFSDLTYDKKQNLYIIEIELNSGDIMKISTQETD